MQTQTIWVRQEGTTVRLMAGSCTPLSGWSDAGDLEFS